METKYFLITKAGDGLASSEAPIGSYDKEFIFETSDNFKFKLYTYINKNNVMVLNFMENSSTETTENEQIWDKPKNFQELCKCLRQEFENYKIIIAIHWGGEGDWEKHTKQFVDDNNKIKNCDCYLTYYSEINDELTNIQDYITAIENRISGREEQHRVLLKIKNEIISHWLPLAIDIQGLSDVIKAMKDDKEGEKKYWLDIKKEHGTFSDFLIPHNEILKGFDELKIEIPDMPELNKLKNFLSFLDEKNPTVGDLKEKKFINPNEGFFLPKWLEKVAKKLDEIKIEYIN